MSDVTNYFMELGIDPFLAGLVIGVLGCIVIRVLRGSTRVKVMGRLQTTREAMEESQAGMLPAITKNVSVTVTNNTLGQAESEAMMAALNSGNKIEAIKIVRESLGLGLKEAKDLVEAIEKSRR